MSSSSNVKSELCRPEVAKNCCALAEAMGTLLFANTFASEQIRIVTESNDFALRLPRLLHKALRVSFDILPEGPLPGKQVYAITDQVLLLKLLNNGFRIARGTLPNLCKFVN